MDFTEIYHIVENRLSPKRYLHSVSTAHMTVDLLKAYHCPISSDDGFLVGMFHDIAREWSEDQLRAYCYDHDVRMEQEEITYPQLLHGPVGALLLQEYMSTVPSHCSLAIRWHTLGSKEMGVLGAALYCADYLEYSRTFITDKERIQLLQENTLEHLCRTIVQLSVEHLEKGGKSGASSTIDLLHYLRHGGTF